MKETKDIQKIVKFCNDNFRDFSIEDLLFWLEEHTEYNNTYFQSMLQNALNSNNNLLLKDFCIGDEDAFSQIIKIMENLHYDNGIPLITKESNYFDFYDRDQEFSSFYNYETIYDFLTDGKEIYIRINISLKKLKEYLKESYDGSNYVHEFGQS